MGERARAGVAGLSDGAGTAGLDAPRLPLMPLPPLLAGRLARRRAQARATLWWERLWPAVFPAVALLGAYACVALLGLPGLLPAWPRVGLLALVGLGCAGLLGRGLLGVARPLAAEVDRRIERASGLRHRPLATLADRPARAGERGPGGGSFGAALADAGGAGTGDPAMAALWRAHAGRAVAQLGRLRVGAPHPGLAARDLRALRGLLTVSLVATLVVAGPDAPGRLALALAPGLPAAPPVPAPVLQAWITPPAYTGEAPTFLHLAGGPGGSAGDAGAQGGGTQGGPVSAPAGSRLVVSLTGGSGRPVLALGGAEQPFAPLGAPPGDAGPGGAAPGGGGAGLGGGTGGTASWQAERVLQESGRLLVRRGGRVIASWDLTVVPDAAPVVAWSSPPGALRGGLRTRLPWRAAHRYGVTALAAELRPAERPGAAPTVVTIPLPGAARDVHGVATPDLLASPWAGLPVTGVLVGRDAQGQVGRSEVARFTLPERTFRNPLARALIATRRRLALDPDQRDAAEADLQALASAPEAFGSDSGVFLNLSDIASLLDEDPAPAAVQEAQDRLWTMALALDGTPAERTQQAVEAARDAVRRQLDTMREQARQDPDAARDPQQSAELDRRLQALRDAIARHLQALAERAAREGALVPQDPQAQQLGQRDIDRLLREAQQAAREGHPEAAQQKLAELQQLLQQLQDAQAMSPEQARQAAENARRGRQQMGAVQDMVRREGQLLDHAQLGSQAPAQGQDPDAQGGQGGVSPGEAQQREAERGEAPGPGPLPGTADGGALPGQPGSPGQAGSAPAPVDARVQRALRRSLGELMQQFGDLAGKVPPSLGEADQAMDDAGGALGRGADPRPAEQRAVAALQKGGQQMGQQMARQFNLSPGRSGQGQGQEGQGQDGQGQDGQDAQGQDGQGEDGQGLGGSREEREGGQQAQDEDGLGSGAQDGTTPGGRRDPLGRLTDNGGQGMGTGDGVRIPDGMERARSRAIQDELRRRGADRSRPQEELDYIGRLLRPF